MDLFKTIANVCLVLLAVIAGGVCCFYGYYHFFVNDLTIGTNYVDNQLGLDVVAAKDLTEEQKNEYEERYFMEASFFSNNKENGIALQELKFNYFTDYTLTTKAYRSTGMQYLGDLKQSDLVITETTEDEAQKYESNALSYYDTTNGVTWEGNKLRTPLNRETNFIIKIDNRAFEIQLTGTYEWTTYERQWYTLWIWNKPITNVLYYNYLNVFADCMQAIRTNSQGYGDYYITVDLSQYFTIREYDLESGKFKENNVTDIIKNYAVLKFHYDENGVRNSTQSIFGIIDCDPKYDLIQNDIDTTYWQERMVYNLTDKDFTLRYSEVYGGYFASLNIDMKKLFEEMPRVKVNLKIDTTFSDKNVVGIDYNGFENFEIDTLTVQGNGTFYLLDKSLYNSKVQTIKHSSGVVLDFGKDAVNNEYVEMVI